MSETRLQVFEALLEDWRQDEYNLIHEFSSDWNTEEALADQQAEEWLTRYLNADAT